MTSVAKAAPDPAKPTQSGANRLPFPLSPSEGWSTVILAAVLVLVTIAAMESLQWTAHLEILNSTAIVGMILGFIMAKQRLVPQWIAEIPAQIIGIGFAFRQTAEAVFQGNWRLLFSHLGAWIQAAAAGRSSNDDAIFLLFLAVLTMLLGYVSMWLIFRSRSPWLAVISNVIVLIISIVYAPDDRLAYMIFFLLAALLLLVRCNLVERMRVWRRKGLRYAPEIGWDFMQAGVLFTIVIMLFGSFLPGNYVNTGLENLWNGPSSPWSQIQNRFTQLFRVVVTGNGQNRVGFGKTLGISGNVNLPTTPVFSYTYTAPTTDGGVADGAYMLGLTYDQFDGKQWSTGTTKDTPIPTSGTIAPEGGHFLPVPQTITVLAPPDGPYIYALGQGNSYSVPTINSSDGIVLNASGQDSYVSRETKTVLNKNQIYTATSWVSAATADQLRTVGEPTLSIGDANYPADLLKRYTELPTDIHDPINKLLTQDAQAWTTTDVNGKPVANTMYDKLEAIVARFASKQFKYSQQNADPNQNPRYDNAMALLDSGQGYCTWFATTMTIMARILGYPARMAVGFVHGTADIPAGSDQKNLGSTTPLKYTVLGSDAHAWVQVYFPGYGWINFEPSVAGGSFTEFQRATTATTDSTDITGGPPKPKGSPTPTTSVTPTTTPGKTTITPDAPSPFAQAAGKVAISFSLVLAIVLLFLLGIGAWWRLLFRALSPISRTFVRMALLGGMAGIRPKPAQTAGEYGAALADQLPEQRGAIEEITELYVRERWSPEPPDHTALGAGWNALRTDLVRRVPHGLLQRFRRRRLR